MPGEVRRVLLVTLALNLVVALAKGIYGAISGSLAVASDAVHSALDAASNVVGLITTTIASSPPDDDHPYGHHKVEILAAACLGLLIAGGALHFGLEAFEALRESRRAPTITAVGFAVVGGTLCVNVFVAWWERHEGKKLSSRFLLADAAHTASDVVVTLGVLASMALSRMGLAWADPVATLAVLMVVGRVAWHLVNENVDVLIDRAVIDPETVQRLALEVGGIRGCHRVRSRGTETLAFLDLHVQVDSEMSVREAHGLSHHIEDRLREAFPQLADVTIHIEPDDDEEEGL